MKIRDWPIGRKFLASHLVVTLAAIIFISAFLILTEFRLVRSSRLANTKAFVGMIAKNSAAALVFDDPQVAYQILSGISAEPNAESAALYNAQGELFARFPTNLPASTFPAQGKRARVHFTSTHLEIFADVLHNDKYAGAAFIRMDLTAMRQRFQLYVITVLSVAGGAILLAFLLSRQLQQWVSRPLISLSRTAKTIADQGNYSLRARREGADELGQLVDAFNHMVEQVETAQGRLRNYASDLERDVAARTAELRNIIGELESFSYSISHDMRAPLRAMQGYAQFLAEECDGKLSDDAKEYINRILRASKRLDILIQDILNYSRIARGDLQLTDVNLDRVLPDILAEYPQFNQNRSQVEVQGPLGWVRGHEAALTQVLSNLIGNAFKFVRPEVAPRVKIWTEQTDETTRIVVEDNGIGIAEKDLARIFGIFERVHDAKAYDGTGIGLSIVKKAVEKMGGTVGVSSQLGVGSRFWIDLRRSTQRNQAELPKEKGTGK